MADQNLQTPEEASDKTAPPGRRWLKRWPVLIPIVLIGGLLWISLWFSDRARLLDESGCHLVPKLPLGNARSAKLPLRNAPRSN